jgi:hypothetical protein
MKKSLLALSLLVVVGSAVAHGPHRMGGWPGGYYGGGCYGCGWIAPMIIGGAIGYELSRPQTVYVEQQPSVIVQQPQTVVQAPPVGYHWQEMIDPATNLRKIVLVPN